MALSCMKIGLCQICSKGHSSLLDVLRLDSKRDPGKNKETVLKIPVG